MSTKITITPSPTEKNNKEQGWNRNTALCVNLKTILRRERMMKPGKGYTGVLKRDVICEDFHYDEHYTFIETLPSTNGKRNPRVFDGEFITVTLWGDGTLHPNFKQMEIGKDFTVDGYALAVCDEIRQALKGLIEK
jgi:hypothetical protein